MKRYKIFASIMALALTTSIVGCSGVDNKLTEEKKIELLNEIKLYDTSESKKTLKELEEMIDKNMDNYNTDERDIMVNKYSSLLYENAGTLSRTLSIIGFELEEVIKNYGVDVTNPTTFKKIPETNATVKGFLEELNAKGFSLEKPDKNGAYIIGIDSVAFNKKYGAKVSESLSKFLAFNAYEQEGGSLANVEERTVDLVEVAKRINMIEEGMKADKKQNYKYASKWISAITYYYPILVGTSHDYFVSTEYLKDDILKQYKELAKTYKDTQLGNILNKIIKIYDNNGKKANSEVMKQLAEIVDGEIYTEELKKALEEQNSQTQSLEEMMTPEGEGVENTEQENTETPKEAPKEETTDNVEEKTE